MRFWTKNCLIALLSYCLIILSGCVPEVGEMGDGRLVVSTSFSGVKTRAGEPAEYTVKIGNARGYTHIFDQSSVPSELWIANGSYFIEVEAGEYFAEPTWDERTPYYKTKQNFTITTGQTTALDVVCKPANSTLAIDFGESVSKYLENYKVELTIPGASTSVVFDADKAGKKVNLMFAGGATDVRWKFTATHDDREIEKEGVLDDLAQGKEYSLTFDYSYIEVKGVLEFSISVDKTTNDSSKDIIIYQRPRIAGVGPYGAIAPVAGHKLTITAAVGNIGALRFAGSIFGDGFDVLTGDLASYGISLAPITAGYELTLGQAFFDRVTGAMGAPAVETGFIITATDDTPEARTNEVYFNIGTASILEIPRHDVWAGRVSVNGISYFAGEVKFAYRVTGGAWNYVAASAEGDNYTAEITGLTPATEYETRLVWNGEMAGTARKFTTETAIPLYNGGFEYWYTLNEGKGVQYANQNGTKFWDSGNYGTATGSAASVGGGRSITTQDAGRPGSTGTSSAKLQSNWFGAWGMGAFAAGNLYTGDFLEARADLSNPSGRVRFGREFTARPSAMSVWYKGSTGTVNYAKSGAPLSTGQQDQYQIAIALVDGNFPREVDTANWGTILNYNTDPDVIAFGEIHGSDAVDWTNVTIPLVYRSLERIPTHIVVVACASRYGDYFTGSTSSVLYVDDFELIY